MKRLLLAWACWLYNLADRSWAPFVDHGAIFTRFVDLMKSECLYCTAARMLFIGAGLMALTQRLWLLGSILLVLPALLVVIERAAQCAAPTPDEPDPTQKEGA